MMEVTTVAALSSDRSTVRSFRYKRAELWRWTRYAVLAAFFGLSVASLYWLWPWNLIGAFFAFAVFLVWRETVWARWRYELVISPQWISFDGTVIDWGEIDGFGMEREASRPTSYFCYTRSGQSHCVRIDDRIEDYPIFIQYSARCYADHLAKIAVAETQPKGNS